MARCKGVLIAGLALALKAERPRVQGGLRPGLLAYLDNPIVPTDWYPESDFEGLLEAAGRMRLAQGHRGDVYAQFGRLAARRDLLGDQRDVLPTARMAVSGQYAHVIRIGQPRQLMRVAPNLWSFYHDTGRLEVLPLGRGCSRLRLFQYAMGSEIVAALHTGYIGEATRIVAGEVEVTLLRSRAQGDGYHLWEIRRPGVSGGYAREVDDTGSFALREMRQAVDSMRPVASADKARARGKASAPPWPGDERS